MKVSTKSLNTKKLSKNRHDAVATDVLGGSFDENNPFDLVKVIIGTGKTWILNMTSSRFAIDQSSCWLAASNTHYSKGILLPTLAVVVNALTYRVSKQGATGFTTFFQTTSKSNPITTLQQFRSSPPPPTTTSTTSTTRY